MCVCAHTRVYNSVVATYKHRKPTSSESITLTQSHILAVAFFQTYLSQRPRIQQPEAEAAEDRDPSHAATVKRASFPAMPQ